MEVSSHSEADTVVLIPDEGSPIRQGNVTQEKEAAYHLSTQERWSRFRYLSTAGAVATIVSVVVLAAMFFTGVLTIKEVSPSVPDPSLVVGATSIDGALLSEQLVQSRKGATEEQFVIIHTTDIHGWIDGHPHLDGYNATFGDFISLMDRLFAQQQLLVDKYSSIDGYEKAVPQLILIDSGDIIEGTGISDATPVHGADIWPVVKLLNYTALTAGNHDIGLESEVDNLVDNVVPFWGGKYLTANVKVYTSSNSTTYLGEPYLIHTTHTGSRILIIGFLYDFTHYADNSYVVKVSESVEEQYFKDAMNEADISAILVSAHIDTKAPETDTILAAIRAFHDTTPVIFLEGHRHIKSWRELDDNAVAMESWCYFKAIGMLNFSVSSEGYLSNVSHSWINTSKENFYDLADAYPPYFTTPNGTIASNLIEQANTQLKLDQVEGCSADEYDPYSPLSSPVSLYALVLNSVYPEVVYDNSSYSQITAMNSHTLRDRLYVGNVTRNDVYSIDPFSNPIFYFQQLEGSLIDELLDHLNDDVERRQSRLPHHFPSLVVPLTSEVDANERLRAAVEMEPRSVEAGLAHYIRTDGDLDPTWKYDVVCTDYDCITFQAGLYDLLNYQVPYLKYDTIYNSTSALLEFIQTSKDFRCE